MQYPRTLFITPVSFNNVTGGGILFTNLFSGWPDSHLAVIHDDANWNDSLSPISSYRLSSKDIRFAWPFYRFLSRTHVNSEGSSSALPLHTTAIESILIRLFKPLLRYFFLASLPEVFTCAPEVLTFVENFRPQVIYTILGSNAMMELVLFVSKHTSAPLCIHIMDDWVTSNHSHGVFALYNRLRMKHLFRKCLERCDSLLTISQAMSSEYLRRYGINSTPVMNSMEGRYPINLNQGTRSLPFKVVYVGSILQNAQLSSIIDISRSITKLFKMGLSIEFHIYCNPKQQQLLERSTSPAVLLHDLPRTNQDYFSIIYNASCLVLPSNFDHNSRKHIKYSMPAKLPSYLSSNVPILLYGPKGTAQSTYASVYNWALIINKRSDKLLQDVFLELFHHPEAFTSFTERAYSCFLKHHQPASTRVLFHQKLADLVHAS
jgi:hypothetical protein